MSAPLLLGLPWNSALLGGFTSTRRGGVSSGDYSSLNLGLNTDDAPESVLENRRLALSAGGAAPGKAVYLRQTHGEGLREALAQDQGRGSLEWSEGLADCDAVFTRVKGLPLAVGHADCLAVALADPEAGLIGLAHAGWRGALAGLPAKLARRLLAEGASPGRLRAVLSPCLGPASLQLGEEQWRLFARAFGRVQDFSTALQHGHFYLDLWACTRMQLLDAGLDAKRLQGHELDTAAHADLFFSHRRDAGKTGRMMTVVYLK